MIPGIPYGIDIYFSLWLFIWLFKKLVPPGWTAWMVPAESPNKNRQTWMFISLCSIWLGVLYGLSVMWYGQSGEMGFHWFNDNDSWLQVDKFGHFFTSFQEARLMMLMWQWTGMRKSHAAVAGMIGGFMYQTPIELLDGFQDAYGASWGDLLANSLGAFTLWLQVYIFGSVKIFSKFSISSHALAAVRPGMFGENFFHQILKDYNGQTYWFSFELRSLIPALRWVPEWFCVSLGYGADGMIGGTENKFQNKEGEWIEFPELDRVRQLYLSFDVNWDKITWNLPWLKTSVAVFSLVKIPAPALEWNAEEGIKWHWLHF